MVLQNILLLAALVAPPAAAADVPECARGPVVDLNTATAAELDTLPYVSAASAEQIISYRPICDPYELTAPPKKISQITVGRVEKNWGCRAYASCDEPAPACDDTARNGDESDVDCGGSCDGCAAGLACVGASDCADGLACIDAVCAVAPTCDDAAQNGDEEGVDCGGAACPACGPTCDDGVLNGDEEGIDCGGASCAPCAGPSVFVLDPQRADNMEAARTAVFRDVPASVSILRRDSEYTFTVTASVASAAEIMYNVTWADANGAGTVVEGWAIAVTDEGTLPDSTRVVTFAVGIPETASVGAHHVNFWAEGVGAARAKVIVLFNPYGSADPVRYSVTQEYVENEEGLIWQGLSDNNAGYAFRFDQFRFLNLEVSLYLLRGLTIAERSDIVAVSRRISFGVNDDLCYGKWGEGSYTSGRPAGGYYCSKSKGNCKDPLEWRSTSEVVDIHLANDRRRAQYCQCFIYAGVTTTVGRSLGIATRVVSNFQSAHDTQANRAIEKFYEIDAEGFYNPVSVADNDDSVWSFHVWVEMYFRRTDLTAPSTSSYYRYGWNAVDSTPQEFSEGVYQMGPASIKHIRKNWHYPCASDAADDDAAERRGCYDNEFVIGEVNSNINLWTRNAGDETFTLLDSYSTDPFGDEFNTIGLFMSTKKPGAISAGCLDEAVQACEGDREDVTSKYKYREPSAPGAPTTVDTGLVPGQTTWPYLGGGDERAAPVLRPQRHYFARRAPDGVAFAIALTEGMILAAEGNVESGAVMVVSLTNNGPAEARVTCQLEVAAMSYAGDYRGQMLSGRQAVQVGGEGGTSECVFDLTYDDMAPFVLADDEDVDPSQRISFMRFRFTGAVSDAGGAPTGQVFGEDLERMVCVPVYMLRSGAVCAGRGRWRPGDYVPSYAATCAALDGVVDDNGHEAVSSYAGDGYCDGFGEYDDTFGVYVNNNRGGAADSDGCWDGGDCCESTCVSTEQYTCGSNGYSCKDPYGLRLDAERAALATAQAAVEALSADEEILAEVASTAEELEASHVAEVAALNEEHMAAVSTLQEQNLATIGALESELLVLEEQITDLSAQLNAAGNGDNDGDDDDDDDGEGGSGGVDAASLFVGISVGMAIAAVFGGVFFVLRRRNGDGGGGMAMQRL